MGEKAHGFLMHSFFTFSFFFAHLFKTHNARSYVLISISLEIYSFVVPRPGRGKKGVSFVR